MIPLFTPPVVHKVPVSMDVIDANIPALLGLDVFDSESLTPCTVSDRLINRVPVERCGGKSYISTSGTHRYEGLKAGTHMLRWIFHLQYISQGLRYR